MKLESLRTVESVTVYKNEERAGTLLRTTRGACFRYDEEFRSKQLAQHRYGISFTLSPEQDEHEITGTNLHPFFAGLLPEGLRLRALRNTLKTSQDDLFSMLIASGQQCIGDVYVELDAQSAPSAAPIFVIADLSEVSFLELFERSITDPHYQMREIDPGIPGMMPKISASMISFPLSLAKRRRHYILKLGTNEHPQLLQNEHFFMQLAAHCGMQVAETQLVQDRQGDWGLLVERFDRDYDQRAKKILRLHQEDACQFLSRYPQDKYRLALREIAESIQHWATSPLIELRKLIELYVFSYLIGNGDLHAKNISLLEDPAGRIRLSPAYDLLSTLPYGDRSMALKLGGKDDNFALRDIIEFAALFKIPEKATRSAASKLIERAANKITELGVIGLNQKKSADILRTFEARSLKLQKE